MWGPPGHSYVYFIYGNHWCFNVVLPARWKSRGGAHPRAGADVRVCELMQECRPVKHLLTLTNGPGKLCAAMDIDRGLDGVDLCDAKSPVFVAENKDVKSALKKSRSARCYDAHWHHACRVASVAVLSRRQQVRFPPSSRWEIRWRFDWCSVEPLARKSAHRADSTLWPASMPITLSAWGDFVSVFRMQHQRTPKRNRALCGRAHVRHVGGWHRRGGGGNLRKRTRIVRAYDRPSEPIFSKPLRKQVLEVCLHGHVAEICELEFFAGRTFCSRGAGGHSARRSAPKTNCRPSVRTARRCIICRAQKHLPRSR